MAIALSGGSTNFTSTIEASPSANRTVTVPDTSFTVAGTDVAQTFSAAQTFSSDITLNAQKDVRFADSDSSNWVAFQAPATISSNVTWTLPATDGTSNQALVTNGSGTLSWATASASPGGSTTQLQYNNAGAFGGISGVTSDGTRITASTTIGVGGATPSTSGSGITFPATQSASSDANTLDDYEEGTWTPVVSDGTNNGTMDGAQTGGTYVKIGNQISINGNLYMTAKGSISGSLRITGLPFTMTNSVVRRTGGIFGYASSLNVTAGQTAVFYTQQNSTYINLMLYDSAGGTTDLQASEVSANLYLTFGFTINL